MYTEMGDRQNSASLLESFGFLAVAAGQDADGARRAGRLYGAAESLREAIGWPRAPAEWEEHEGQVAAARARLGEAAFATAWAEGRAMTLEQAIAHALEA
jgi:hypothetical protein